MSEKELLEWAMMLACAEEVARQAVKVEVKPVVEVKPTPSHVVDRRNIVVEGEEIIVHRLGYGVLQEFMAKAEDPGFQILVEKDGDLVVYGSYSHYAEISQQVEEIDAFEVNGTYVFKVNDIEFAESLTVKVTTTKPVRFQAIFAKFKLSSM
jgi:hypothetical protein